MIYYNLITITIFNFFVINILLLLTTKLSLKYNFVDSPNERSLHKKNIPNLGGLPIIIIFYLNIVLFYDNLTIGEFLFLSSLFTISFVGFLDDLYSLSSLLRFSIQILVSSIAILGFIYENYSLLNNFYFSYYFLIFFFFSMVFSVWLINIFNFMDGINGLVSIKSFLFIISLLFFTYNNNILFPDSYTNLSVTNILLLTLLIFFIPWNFPKAKIFMGDSLSYFLGFYISFIILILTFISFKFLWVSLILLSLFIADTSFTLVNRLVKKTNIFKAHKSHAYQKLAEYFHSHTLVTFLESMIFIIILFPLSYFIIVDKINGMITTIIIYTILIFIIFLINKLKSI